MSLEKVYTIKINGLDESVKNAESLATALERLQAAAKTQATASATLTAEQKSAAKAAQELADAQAKLERITGDEGAELIRLRQSIADATKARKEELQAARDAQTISEKDLTTYKSKQAYLSALNRQIRSYVASTAEEQEKLAQMVAESGRLQQELKDFDAGLNQFQRNVGNYAGAVEPIKSQIREIEQQLQQMMAAGVDPASESFQALAKEAGRLKDIQGDVAQMTKAFASDTAAIDSYVGGVKDAVAVATLWESAMAGLGVESEAFEETLIKLQSLQASLNALQTISNDLQNQSSLLFKAKTAVLGLYSKGMAGATLATKAFSLALKTIGIGLIVSAIAYLVEYFDDIKAAVGDLTGGTERLSRGWEKMMSVIKGVGAVIVNNLINPLKTAFNIAKRLVTLDFKGALNEMTAGVKRQMNVVENFNKAYNRSQASYAEERTRKQAAENAKRLKNEIDTAEAMFGADYKYTQKGRKLYADYYKALAASQKAGSDDARKTELDRLKYQKALDDKDEERRKKALENLKKYREARLKYGADTSKIEEDAEKQALDAERRRIEAMEALDEESLAARRRGWKAYYDGLDTIAEQSAEKEIAAAKTEYAELIKAAREAGASTAGLSDELAGRILAIETRLGEDLVANQEKMQEQLAKDRQAMMKKVSDDAITSLTDAQTRLKERLQTLNQTDIKAPTLGVLRDMEEAYRAYLGDLEAEQRRWAALITEAMDKVTPDSEEYARLLAKKTAADKEYAATYKAVSAKIEDTAKRRQQVVMDDIKQMTDALGDMMNGIIGMADTAKEALGEEVDAIGEKMEAVAEKIAAGEERITGLSERLTEATGAERLALQEQLAEEQAANEQRIAQQQALAAEEKHLKQEQAQLEYKQKRASLVGSLATGIADAALSIIKCFSQLGPIAGAVSAAAVGAVTAVNIAAISKQLAALKPAKFEKGGMIRGPRHSAGGVKFFSEDGAFEAEGGEMIMSRRAVARWGSLLEAMNKSVAGAGGRPGFYRDGGVVSAPAGADSRILEAIRGIDINPVVSVVDIERKGQSLARVRELARG